MGLRLLLYLGILCIGIFIGIKNVFPERLMKRMDKLQLIVLFILLFIMGLRIGADDTVVDSLGFLGIEAFIIATCSIIVSIGCVFIARKFLNLDGKGEK